ncbi:MAG: AarF/ABC1/UbiB kinase family protein [Deltaproteobacteria bacterium]|nr:MAG: AarF/ABC1/UbiB kinase family protein [Deltaproteobacteria bacterium]
MSVLRTLVASSRALVSGAKDAARLREIAAVFVRHGFGWVLAQLKIRRELGVDEDLPARRPDLASAETGRRLAAAFSELGPTFVKLGQILSTRPDLLPAPVIAELTKLQDNVSPLPFETIEAQIERNLSPEARARIAEIDRNPLAAASIAQVHRATLTCGRKVVFKVQRPGIRRKIESDTSIMLALASQLEDAFDEARAMDVVGVVQGFAKSILQEIDFRIEARNLERFRHNFREHANVVFPAVESDLSTSEVLCMEYIEGRKFSDLIEAGEDIRPWVDTYFDGAYKMLFIDGFFHGDLHPGNVFVLDEGKLAVIDCGMVGRLSPSMQDKIIEILHAVLNEDLEAVARTFYALAIPQGPVDYQAFERDVVEIAERYLVGVPLSEIQIGALFGELVEGATRHRVRMPTDFTMMFKAILTTEGLAKTLAPDVDPLDLARPFIEEMVRRRYSPERLKQIALTDLGMYQRMLRSLPQTLPDVLRDLKDGKLAFRVAPETLDRFAEIERLRTAQLGRTAVGIACLLAGTYAWSLDLPTWPLLGMPYPTAVLYGLAAFSLWRASGRWRPSRTERPGR